MKILDSEFLLEIISPTFRAFKENARLRASIEATIAIDARRSKEYKGYREELRVKDEHYLLSLRSLLLRLSKKIDGLVFANTFTLAQFFSTPLNLRKLVHQVDELYKALDNPRAEHIIKDGVDPLVRLLVTLCGDLITLSEKIRGLAAITHDSELESFYTEIVGSIAMLSKEEGILISKLLPGKDKDGSGGNSGNGSGHGGGGFPGPNPKLMSSNRSMPWHQPRYFL